MISGRDSSFSRPTAAQIPIIKNAGVSIWNVYVATKPNVGLAAPWSKSDIDIVRALGSQPIAYVSGWDDPVALKQLAQQWDIKLALDVEAGIRGDGPWVDSFLAASDAGLYGTASVHTHTAPFHILAAYPGFDPKATWSPTVKRPNTPVGWQWRGTHTEFGLIVDSLWLDDWFGGSGMATIDPTDPVAVTVGKLAYLFLGAPDGAQAELTNRARSTDDAVVRAIPLTLQAIQTAIQNVSVPIVDVNALAAALASDAAFLAAIADAVVAEASKRLSS